MEHNTWKTHLVDYYDADEQELDIVNFLIAEDVNNKRDSDIRLQKSKKKVKLFRSRNSNARKDPRVSVWWTDYCLDEGNTFKDPEHRDGKLFRNRFYLGFDGISIVNKISKPENYFWKSNQSDAFGRPAHPIRLLVLSSMRILTRNCTLDDVYEATFISPTVIAAFFKAFVNWYSKNVTPKIIRMPVVDQESMRSNGSEYIAAGFSLVIMSLDVVHIRLWGCLAILKQVSTRKEKFPSRAFELGCNNRRMIVSATRGFYGSVVDKSIVKFNGAVNSVRSGKYENYQYELYNVDNNLFIAKGGAILLDNGYLQIPTMMEPSKWATTFWEIKWSEMAESLRKDIECLNGELESGFGILKYGPRFGDLDLIDDIY